MSGATVLSKISGTALHGFQSRSMISSLGCSRSSFRNRHDKVHHISVFSTRDTSASVKGLESVGFSRMKANAIANTIWETSPLASHTSVCEGIGRFWVNNEAAAQGIVGGLNKPHLSKDKENFCMILPDPERDEIVDYTKKCCTEFEDKMKDALTAFRYQIVRHKIWCSVGGFLCGACCSIVRLNAVDFVADILS